MVPGGPVYGFPPLYYPSATDFEAAGTIQLTAGQTFQADLSLVRQPYYPVKIPVANAEGMPGVNVTVSPQGRRGPGYSLIYNGGGQRIEGQLPNGNYLVEAKTFGMNSASGAVNITVAGAPVEGPGLVLTRNSSIMVNVKEEFTTSSKATGSWSDGRRTFTMHGPRIDLNVRAEGADDIEPQRGGSPRPPNGPNDDSLVIEDLEPGRYWLQIYAMNGYVASATAGVVDVLHQPLVVGPGSSTPVDITMRDDYAEIDGTVGSMTALATTAFAGDSPATAYIYCVPLADSPGQFQQLGVSSDGKFSSSRMAPGAYRVMAFNARQPNLPYRDTEAMRAYETKGQVVHLSPGEKTAVQLQISSSEE
jgi:hypothetical protein